jgi:hypothetical protein
MLLLLLLLLHSSCYYYFYMAAGRTLSLVARGQSRQRPGEPRTEDRGQGQHTTSRSQIELLAGGDAHIYAVTTGDRLTEVL